MKKNIKYLSFLLFAGLALTACSSDDELEPIAPQQGKKIWKATVGVGKDTGMETRALNLDGTSLKVGWNTSEKVYVFKGEMMVGTLSPTTTTTNGIVTMTGSLDGNGYTAGEAVTLRFPRETIDYTGQDGTLATIAQKYDYAESITTVKSASGSNVSFNNTSLTSLQAIVKFTFDTQVKLVSIYSSMMSEPITIVPAAATNTIFAALPLTGISTVDYVISGVDKDGYPFTITKSNIRMQNGKYYSADLSTSNHPSTVDLGLSVEWKTTNLGTSKVTEEGNRYAWGETTTKETYTLSNYKYYNTSTSKYTKYVTNSNYGTIDNKSKLELNDDAASTYYNGTWHTPTKAEWAELNSENCFLALITISGSKYVLVTSKKTGCIGNAVIFKWNLSYMSSTLSTSNNNFYAGFFNTSGNVPILLAPNVNRYSSFPVRPVKEK